MKLSASFTVKTLAVNAATAHEALSITENEHGIEMKLGFMDALMTFEQAGDLIEQMQEYIRRNEHEKPLD